MNPRQQSARGNCQGPARFRTPWQFLLLALGFALASCGSSFTCRGCVENTRPGHVDYRYNFFNGTLTRNANADAGQTLTLDYAVTVDEGTLDMRVVEPGGQAVWQETFDTGANIASSTQVDIQQSGRYQLIVEGHRTRGGFQIDWQVN
jgi:hypothetical protein